MKRVANGRANGTEEKLFNFRPMLFAAIFLILGVVFAYYFLFEELSVWWTAALLPVFLIFLLFRRNRKELYRRALVVLLLGVFFFVGFFSFRLQIYAYENCAPLSGRVNVAGTVEGKNFQDDGSVTLLLRRVSVDGNRIDGRLIAYLPPSFIQNIAVADRVVLTGEIAEKAEAFNEFGFADSRVTKKIRYSLSADKWQVAGQSVDITLLIRARMEEVLYAGMDESSAGLTLALLTGDSSGFDADLEENIRYGGISHIFAVSGLNVGALFGFCLLLFTKTRLRRAPKWIRFFSVVGVLTLYCGICAFTASVVRAAVMCVIGYFFKLLGGGYDLLDALGGAAIVILLLCPSELFGVGFQLSFLACVGLVLLTKPIGQVFDEGKKLLQKYVPKKYTQEERLAIENGDTLPRSVGEDIYVFFKTLLSASVAAQITTAPALLLHFGYLSGWSLLLNFIFVPFTDGIFTALLLMTAVACLFPAAFSGVLLYLPSVVWSAATLVFETVDFSSFALRNLQLSLGICVCYYGGLTFLSDKWNLSKRWRAALACVCFLACGIALSLLNA